MRIYSSTQHPSEVQNLVARMLGVPGAGGGVRVPADGRGIRRQGIAGGAVGVSCRPRGTRHRPPRQGSPRPRRRHDDGPESVTTSVWTGAAVSMRAAYSRGSTWNSTPGAGCSADPVARCERSGDVPCRQRLLLSGGPDSLASGAHRHGVEHRVPRIRRSAGHAVRRADDGRDSDFHRARPARGPQAQPLRTGARREPVRNARAGQRHGPPDSTTRAHQRLCGGGGERLHGSMREPIGTHGAGRCARESL